MIQRRRHHAKSACGIRKISPKSSNDLVILRAFAPLRELPLSMNHLFRHLPVVARGLGALALFATSMLPLRAAHAGDLLLGSSSEADLKTAINNANNNPGPDTITIAAGVGTVVLTSALPTITGELTIRVQERAADAVIHNSSPSNNIRIFTIVSGATVTLSHLVLSGGNVPGFGGAVNNTGVLTMKNCTLRGNSAGGGGAISTFGATLRLEDCIFYGNTAIQQGGAIQNSNNGQLVSSLEISRCTFTGNTASRGGAIANDGTLFLSRSTFSGNHAAEDQNVNLAGGGALFSSGTANVSHSTFHRNLAGINGGAIVNQGTLKLFSSTLVDNAAQMAGGIDNVSGTLTVKSTLFGTGASGQNLRSSASAVLTSQGFNLSDDATGPNNGTSDRINTLTGLDPNGLQNNGGPTQTVALRNSSAALDAGSGADLDSSGTELSPSTDQRGFARTFDVPNRVNASGSSGADIGAFERQNSAPVLDSAVFGGRVNAFFTRRLNGSDADGQTLTYAVERGSTLPPGLSLRSDGLIFGTPTSKTTFAGVSAAISVSDGAGLQATATFTFFIQEAGSLVVNTNADSNTFDDKTSLANAIDFANENKDQSNISFDLAPGNRVITLTRRLPLLLTDVSITGPTTGGGVTLSGSQAPGARGFAIVPIYGGYVPGVSVALSFLTIANGGLDLDDEAGFNGGICNQGGNVVVTNCTIVGNTSLVGGGVLSTGASMVLRNCTLTDNSATSLNDGGGAIAVFGGSLELDSCTVVGNRAPQGKGAGLFVTAYNPATITIGNCIIVNNFVGSTSTTGNDLDIRPDDEVTFVSNGFNLIGEGVGVDRFRTGGDATGNGGDVRIGPLADNGGPTKTMALLPGSLAINQGGTSLSIDQRGTPRPQSGGYDRGAFERVNRLPVLSPATLTGRVGVSFSLRLPTTDADGEELFYQVVQGTLPAGLTLSPEGLISGTPTNASGAAGARVSISATDRTGGVARAVFTFLIEETPSLVVNSPLDTVDRFDGRITLREAVLFAKSKAGRDTITFNLGTRPQTLTLSRLDETTFAGSSLIFNDDLIISGPGANLLTIRRDAARPAKFRLLRVQSGALTLSRVTLAGGFAAGDASMAYGGGVFVDNAKVALVDCVLTGNTADLQGGALFLNGGTLALRSCTFFRNTAPTGSALSIGADSSIYNSTFAQNSGAVGAIHHAAGALTLDSCTVAGNSASNRGGGINKNAATLKLLLNNTIIAGNSGGDVSGTPTTNTFNIIGGTAAQAGLQTSGGVPVLKINGGTTPTIALVAGGAFNRGNTRLLVDQRGVARPQNGLDDIGAVEMLFADQSAPQIAVDTPAANANVPRSSFGPNTVTGSASDNFSVSGAFITLGRVRGGVTQFWNGSSFGSGAVSFPLTLASPDAPGTRWSWTSNVPRATDLDTGSYAVSVFARDASNNISPIITRTFSLSVPSSEAPQESPDPTPVPVPSKSGSAASS